MVDVRCKEFGDNVWTYVVENARLRKMSRCEALEQIVLEHMKFMNKEHQNRVK